MKLIVKDRNSMKENPCLISDNGKELKEDAIPTPNKLFNTLRAEKVKLGNLMFLKDSLNNWADILSDKLNDRNNP